MSTLSDDPVPNGAPKNAFYKNLSAIQQRQQDLDSGVQGIVAALERNHQSVDVGRAIAGAIGRVAESIKESGDHIALGQNRLANLKAAEVARHGEQRWAALLAYVDHNGEFIAGTAGGELLRRAARGHLSLKNLVGSRGVPAQAFANAALQALQEFGLADTKLTEHDFLMFHAVAPYVLEHIKARQPWERPATTS